jgi:hypothetical protein
LLGLALAFNLAYLNLPIFDFLRPLSVSIGKKLTSLSATLTAEVENTQWFKLSKRIAAVCDEEDALSGITPTKWITLKSYLQSFFFNVFFLWRLGKVGSILSATYAVIFIFLGVIFNYGYLNAIFCYSGFYGSSPIAFSFLAMIWPILCVVVSAWLKWVINADIIYNLKDLGKKAEDEAKNTTKQVENAVDGYVKPT